MTNTKSVELVKNSNKSEDQETQQQIYEVISRDNQEDNHEEVPRVNLEKKHKLDCKEN